MPCDPLQIMAFLSPMHAGNGYVCTEAGELANKITARFCVQSQISFSQNLAFKPSMHYCASLSSDILKCSVEHSPYVTLATNSRQEMTSIVSQFVLNPICCGIVVSNPFLVQVSDSEWHFQWKAFREARIAEIRSRLLFNALPRKNSVSQVYLGIRENEI